MSDATFWDKAAPKYALDPISDPEAYALTRDRMREILQPHHKVLELGCGTGSTALELADRAGSYLATDISPKMIEIARGKQNGDTPASLRFAVQNAGTLPEGAFDVVIGLNLFHLVRNLEDVLAAIHAALPSGGMLIAKTGLLKDGLWVLPWIIPVMRLIGKAPYVRSLGASDMRDLLQNAGFVVEESLIQKDTVPRIFTVARKP